MKNDYHKKYQFGIMDDGFIRGIGSVRDLLAFFEAIQLIAETPSLEYPFLWSLRRKPLFGKDVLPLFEEAQQIRPRMAEVVVTDELLAQLGVDRETTKLKIDTGNLAGIFERVFKFLTEEGPEYIEASKAYPELNPLETGSVRLGPIEPLIPSRFFQQLPASAFDDNDPPLWLRDEIFDEAFYRGKI